MQAQPNVFTLDSTIEEMRKSPNIQGKQFIEDPELESLGKRVIEEQNLEIGEAQIGYMLVYPNVSKKVAGRCKKCSKEVQYYSGNNFLIQMSGETWDILDQRVRYILMYHELLHVKATFKAKSQEWKYSIRDHDFEDFYEIQKEYGLEWFETIQATNSSLYDLDISKENSVGV